ncbi:MAG: IS21 family transposase, partial [Paludibacteraceae bacterium]|nr:IS21 family transposase [Paludibacteraceae bacterium]
MWYKVNELSRDGLNKSQISRKLGIDRGTVRQYLRMSEEEFLSSSICQREYSHKLDEYEPFVLDLLRGFPGFSCRQIEDRLKERYGDSLKDVCSKTVFNFV